MPTHFFVKSSLTPPAFSLSRLFLFKVCLYTVSIYVLFVFLHVAQLVKLLEQREANHIEFCRIKNVLDEIWHMYNSSELNEILKLLMDPTWMATGLKIDFETLVSSEIGLCEFIFVF